MSLRFAFSLGNEIPVNIAAERHYDRGSGGCLSDWRNRCRDGGTNEESASCTPRGEELVNWSQADHAERLEVFW